MRASRLRFGLVKKCIAVLQKDPELGAVFLQLADLASLFVVGSARTRKRKMRGRLRAWQLFDTQNTSFVSLKISLLYYWYFYLSFSPLLHHCFFYQEHAHNKLVYSSGGRYLINSTSVIRSFVLIHFIELKLWFARSVLCDSASSFCIFDLRDSQNKDKHSKNQPHRQAWRQTIAEQAQGCLPTRKTVVLVPNH